MHCSSISMLILIPPSGSWTLSPIREMPVPPLQLHLSCPDIKCRALDCFVNILLASMLDKLAVKKATDIPPPSLPCGRGLQRLKELLQHKLLFRFSLLFSIASQNPENNNKLSLDYLWEFEKKETIAVKKCHQFSQPFFGVLTSFLCNSLFLSS